MAKIQLKKGDEVYVLINMNTHWHYKLSRIIEIENGNLPEKPIRVFFYDSPYCAVQEQHIFHEEHDARVAVAQLNEAIKRSEGTHGEE
jgi:hypothetical protein